MIPYKLLVSLLKDINTIKYTLRGEVSERSKVVDSKSAAG